MKRFTSIVWALAVIVSLFASTPQMLPTTTQSSVRKSQETQYQNTPTTPQKRSTENYIPVAKAPQAETINWEGTFTGMQYFEESKDYCYMIDIPEYGSLQLDVITGDRHTYGGTFSSEQGNVIMEWTAVFDKNNQPILKFTKVDLVIKAEEGLKGTIDITGTLIGEDGNTYLLTAHFDGLPKPETTIEVKANDMVATGAMFTQITASDDKYNVEIVLMGSGDRYYGVGQIMSVTLTEKETGTVLSGKPIYAELEVSNKGKKVVGDVLTEDKYAYIFDLTMFVPEAPDKTVHLDYTDAKMDIQQGMFMFQAGPTLFPDVSENPIALSIAFFAHDPITGTYDDGDVVTMYTQFVYLNPDNLEEVVYAVSGYYELTAQLSEVESAYVCNLSIWGYDNIKYEIKMTAPIPAQGGLEHDEPEKAVDLTLDVKPTLEYDEEYGVVYCDFSRPNDMTSLLFFVNEKDPEITIPAGTYEINNTQSPFTVMASTGVNQQGYLQYSFYGELDKEGYVTRCYFFVSGSVVVENKDGKLHMVIDARNSYDVPIHIEYDGSAAATALDNTTSEHSVAQKILAPDGQIYILRAGHTYTTDGQLVK